MQRSVYFIIAELMKEKLNAEGYAVV